MEKTVYKNPEEMTLDEIKEQLALYSRLYYHKRREDPDYMVKKRRSALNSHNLRKMEKYMKDNDMDVNEVKLKDIQDLKQKNTNKKPYETKYSMKNCKVIQVVNEDSI